MERRICFELTNEIEEEFNNNINKIIHQFNLDYFPYGLIVPEQLAKDVEALVNKEGCLEGTYPLYFLLAPLPKQTFTDFGIISKQKKYYLYEELSIPFSISGKNEKDVEHALEQMEEHLIAMNNTPIQKIYFVERYHKALIEGIARAYKINVVFYL